MDRNIIRDVFAFFSAYTIILGLLINFMESFLPASISCTYLYGKFVTKMPHPIAKKFEVPKRWYKHFYIFAAPVMTCTLCLLLYKYLYNGNVPEIILILLDIFLGTSRKPLIPTEDAILAIIICNIHCWKRVYETCYVNVFSDQKMHISIYLVGHLHYFGLALCIIGESEEFVRDSHINMSLHKMTTVKLICVLICLWLSYMQLKINFILARIRKNLHGDVVSYEYKIPSDGLFKYIAGPLQLFEILIYLMLSIILWQASTYHYVTIWVILNQVEYAFLSHRWYCKTFKNYPKERKILIPYIW
ncbi:hypothetical protein P5V15_014774 [Pogonomyrmex californicus]